MMTKTVIVILVLISSWTNAFSCLNTYQFKIFPVGVHLEKIITVDVQIRRTSHDEGSRWLGLDLDDPGRMQAMWILYTHIASYDKNQKIQTLTPVDTVYTIGKNYTETLLDAYQTAYNSILKQHPSIELFAPEYISFCDYQKKCDLLSVTHDTLQNSDYLTFETTKYPVAIISDSTYYAFNNSPYYSGSTAWLYTSSVRIYKTATMTLVMTHLETGHEIAMGWITDDPNKLPEEEGDPVIVSREHKPDFEFKDIKKAVFKEPLLHHGYGIDLFVVKE